MSDRRLKKSGEIAYHIVGSDNGGAEGHTR